MMRLSDRWLLAGLMLLLMVISAIAAVQQMQAQTLPPLSTASNEPDGARALFLWLEALGYPVSGEVGPTFTPPPEASLMLMLEPMMPVTESEWLLVDAWVEAGGTLILAGRRFAVFGTFGHYDLMPVFQAEAEVAPIMPLLASPAPAAAVRSGVYFNVNRTDFAPLLASNGRPVAVTWQQGEGRVIATTLSDLFSNASLKRDGAAELLLSLISAAEPGPIWFNEWHHGRRSATVDPVGPVEWLQNTAPGQALLYMGLILLLFLLLRGRRFGRPVPLLQEMSRRSPLEYVTAIANLNRRAGHRAAVLGHYHQRLKRELGWRYHLDPGLSDADYVQQLARYRPDLDTASLANLLRRLRQPQMSERELVMLVGEAVSWLAE
jgi:hypothetical protein